MAVDHRCVIIRWWFFFQKKYLGSLQPLFKSSMAFSQNRQKWKNSRISSNFGHTYPSFCIPPMIHINAQLLFFEQKKSRPNQTSGGNFVFLQKHYFWTLGSYSSIAEGLSDPWKLPKRLMTFHLNCKHIILEVIYWKFGELFILIMSVHIMPPPPCGS